MDEVMVVYIDETGKRFNIKKREDGKIRVTEPGSAVQHSIVGYSKGTARIIRTENNIAINGKPLYKDDGHGKSVIDQSLLERVTSSDDALKEEIVKGRKFLYRVVGPDDKPLEPYGPNTKYSERVARVTG